MAALALFQTGFASRDFALTRPRSSGHPPRQGHAHPRYPPGADTSRPMGRPCSDETGLAREPSRIPIRHGQPSIRPSETQAARAVRKLKRRYQVRRFAPTPERLCRGAGCAQTQF